VLMDLTFVNWRSPAASNLLADWLPIMRADPRFNEDDWFTNAFEPLTRNDRLIAFPTEFRFEAVSANATIPGLMDIVSQKNTISYFDMIYIFNALSPGDFSISNCFDVVAVFWSVMSDFLCIDSGLVDFNNDAFIDFIYRYREKTSPDRVFGSLVGLSQIFGTNLEVEYSYRYLFVNQPLHAIMPLLHIQNSERFDGFLPLVCNNDNLLISFQTGFALNAGASPAQKALAWDFIQFALQPGNRQGLPETMQSTHIPLFRHDTARYISRVAQSSGFRPIYGDLESHTARAIEKFYQIARLPMEFIAPVDFAISIAYYEILSQFHDGLISGRQAAEYLQNRITIILMEMD